MLHRIAIILFSFLGSVLTTVAGLTLVEYGPSPTSHHALAYGLTALAFAAVLCTDWLHIDSLLPHWSWAESLAYTALSVGVLCLFLDHYSAAACAYLLCLLVQNQPIKITPPSMRVVDPPSSSTSDPASILIVGADSSIRDDA